MWNRSVFHDLVAPPAIGMIHLLPLPGSPGWGGDMETVLAAALADARALAEGGLKAVMMENYHDVPFHPGQAPPETVAGVTAAAMLVRREFPDLHLGINVLRNDVVSALGVAAAVGARFVRVNVHTGAAVTDQGTIQGQAWRTLRRRRELGADRVAILADLRVKHARPLVERPLAEEVSDLRSRGLADGVIVSGVATGAGADPAEAAMVREALPEGPILVGSGTTAENVGAFLPAADGFIIGSSLQEPDPVTGRRKVSAARTAAFVAALKTATEKDTWQ